ncbi:transglutaminaseTgpA domain-containing protein [Priestia filamentosa]|uniref:transglutaminase family protein n=1 Tax=Priestia filamentosa TaxID=1402861 RepID=UPI00030A7986|nr:transglutaminase domain-containing protein [Priestia filamentosa]
MNVFTQLLLYFGSFFLLWEWLKPLETVTNTGGIHYFLAFIILNFLLAIFVPSLLIKWTVKLVYMYWSLYQMFGEGGIADFSLLSILIENLSNDFASSSWMDVYSLTTLSRTVLFFLILWVMCYVIYYWVILQKNIFFFLLLTLIYVTILDTFSPYEAFVPIIRIVFIGLFLLSFLHFERLKEITENRRISRKMTVLSLIIIMISMTAAYIAPKPSPKWPDPVPYLQGYAEGVYNGDSGSGQKKVGFGEDDSELGGGFSGDDTLVFTAATTQDNYWKIETKNTYTGKGWVASEDETNKYELDNLKGIFQYNKETVPNEKAEAELTFANPSSLIMYPASFNTISSNPESDFLVQSVEKERIISEQGEVNSLQYTYDYPEYKVEILRGLGSEKDEKEDNPLFQQTYTQLPENVPQRVRDLAVEITGDQTNRYDKAKAIEYYFSENPYVYDTEDIAVPKENEDYVDQFLFETKRGYCDNFSTSMVVLLRSVDIPARWVKGYTQGSYVETKGDKDIYEVTENNAHSWVEVYFPTLGWVPFEPTKSFSNPYDFTYDLEENENAAVEESDDTRATPAAAQPVQEEEKSTAKETKESGNSLLSSVSIDKIWIILLFLIALIGVLLYVTRQKWMPTFLIRMYRPKDDKASFNKAYKSLLKQWQRKGVEREKGQTLRQFAAEVDERIGTKEMSKLTFYYEEMVYREQYKREDSTVIIELWENLIKKASS